ncbi:hypothetical protein B0T19DRAFT_409044 [Cercophora scortea]|uniref:Uncharacterized protein n=1 Tax=Cercophora scortea TaxID=314031 RepID=A0AAE0MM98_9PEZI|nr:hypothetical protein B0T19DRAFT_409044 [Cercophora scortea]
MVDFFFFLSAALTRVRSNTKTPSHTYSRSGVPWLQRALRRTDGLATSWPGQGGMALFTPLNGYLLGYPLPRQAPPGAAC